MGGLEAFLLASAVCCKFERSLTGIEATQKPNTVPINKQIKFILKRKRKRKPKSRRPIYK